MESSSRGCAFLYTIPPPSFTPIARSTAGPYTSDRAFTGGWRDLVCRPVFRCHEVSAVTEMSMKIRATVVCLAGLAWLAFPSFAGAQSCAQIDDLLRRGMTVLQVARATGLSSKEVEACRRGLRQGQVNSPAGPPPYGAAGPAPHGAAGPASHGAPGPAPHGAPGPAPHGAPGPAPHGAAGPAPFGAP
jgi:hypothetical protein